MTKYSREQRAKHKETEINTGASSVDEDTSLGPAFFWREFEEPYGFMSQWHISHFKDPEMNPTHVFNCAEQYMMFRKALVLATPDPESSTAGTASSGSKKPNSKPRPKQTASSARRLDLAAQQLPDAILAEQKPKKQKSLARSVKFTQAQMSTWETIKFDVVTHGSHLKYSQNPELKAKLLATGDRELIEASPHDREWGIGFAAEVAMHHRNDWGRNLLGKALMTVREQIRAEQEVMTKTADEGVQ